MGLGKIDEAITEFERAIDLNPESGYSYLQLALLYALRGRRADAERIARQAVDLQERYVSGSEGLQVVGAHTRLGYILYRGWPVRRCDPGGTSGSSRSSRRATMRFASGRRSR